MEDNRDGGYGYYTRGGLLSKGVSDLIDGADARRKQRKQDGAKRKRKR